MLGLDVMHDSTQTLHASAGGHSGPLAAVLGYLGQQPFILLFLVVAIGYAIGRIEVKKVNLGATAATLIVGLVVSLIASAIYGIKFSIPEFASNLFFNLFMFSVGVKVGPQFIAGLRRDAKKFVILGLLVPFLSLGLALLANLVFKLPPGMLPGVFAGANTATPGLGAAQSAFASGAAKLPAGISQQEAVGNMSTAFAFTYSLSMVLFIVMMKLLPKFFHRDVVADAKSLEKELETGAPLPGSADAFLRGALPTDTRIYRVDNPELAGLTVGYLRRTHPEAAIERIERDGKVIDRPADDFAFTTGDRVSLTGRLSTLLDASKRIGPELDDPRLYQDPPVVAEIVIHRASVVGEHLRDVASEGGYGLYLEAMFRAGTEIPHGPDTVIQKGDVLRVVGSERRIDDLKKVAGGNVVEPSFETDIITVAVGLSLGAFLGAITIPIGGIRFSLGSAVGLLIVGIAFGTIRTRSPDFGGPFPEPARRLLEDLGLNIFIAVLGLNAGAGVLDAVRTGALGPALLVALVVGFLPAIAAWIEGQYRMKMNSALLMGAVSGARCNSGGMRASQEAAESTVPAMAYPVTFAISNIVLTLMCYLLVLFG